MIPNPGTFPLCRRCVHRDEHMHEQGHPNPCACYGWRGEKHHKPTITRTADGSIECSDFMGILESRLATTSIDVAPPNVVIELEVPT